MNSNHCAHEKCTIPYLNFFYTACHLGPHTHKPEWSHKIHKVVLPGDFPVPGSVLFFHLTPFSLGHLPCFWAQTADATECQLAVITMTTTEETRCWWVRRLWCLHAEQARPKMALAGPGFTWQSQMISVGRLKKWTPVANMRGQTLLLPPQEALSLDAVGSLEASHTTQQPAVPRHSHGQLKNAPRTLALPLSCILFFLLTFISLGLQHSKSQWSVRTLAFGLCFLGNLG